MVSAGHSLECSSSELRDKTPFSRGVTAAARTRFLELSDDKAADASVEVALVKDRAAAEVIINCTDRSGLLAAVCAAIASAGLNIEKARRHVCSKPRSRQTEWRTTRALRPKRRRQSRTPPAPASWLPVRTGRR